jgi:hypothetical protein
VEAAGLTLSTFEIDLKRDGTVVDHLIWQLQQHRVLSHYA